MPRGTPIVYLDLLEVLTREYSVPMQRPGDPAGRATIGQILALATAAVEKQPGTDFDDLITPGLYILTSDVHAPFEGGRWLVWVDADPLDPGSVLQRSVPIAGGSVPATYLRRSAAAIFGDWRGGDGVQAEDVGWVDGTWWSTKANVKEVLVAIGEWLYALDRGVGDIYPVTRTTLRDNELKANGALLSRASYPELWAHAQSSGLLVTEANWASNNQGSFSSGDGSTTFRIPDLRGDFLRGWDDGRGVDSGRVAGTFQGFAIQSHVHPIAGYEGSTGGGTGATVLRQTGGTFNVGSTGGTETRPRNVAYMVVIRFR